MSIPLVQNNEKDSINTSIIAIKKNLERINSLLGLVDSSGSDLSGLATKQELEDAVTEINNTIDEVETSLQPVDAVASGDMHSVTSNAVASAINLPWQQMTIANSGDNVINGSNLYTVYLDLPNGSTIYYITGWLEFKAGTVPNSTVLFSLPKKAYINTRVVSVITHIGNNSNIVNTNVCQFWIGNNSKDVTSGGVTFNEKTRVQFNSIIIGIDDNTRSGITEDNER